MTNLEIAEILRAVAGAYQLEDQVANKFKIIAYQKAADAVEHLSSEAKDIWDEGKLTGISGIGPSITQHLSEIFETGKSKHFDEVLGDINPAVFELMKISGIGVKTAVKLVNEFKISSKKPIDQLEKLAKEGKVDAKILSAIKELKGREVRILLPHAQETADKIIEYLLQSKKVIKADPLGSLRRKSATIGDVDIAVATNDPVEVMDYFCSYPKAARIIEKGVKTASIIVPGNIQVDLLVGPPETYGSMLQHFTGSKHHNVALREYALKKNMSLSEYGIKINEKIEKFATEQDFYKKLGMDWIPPELREDTGEINMAIDHKIPQLIELEDVKGDFQIHSDFDIETSHDVGASSMEEIIEEAEKLNYEYLAFTEHNPSKSKHTKDQIVEILKRKREKIDKINYSRVKNKENSVRKVFNSLEIDILPDGTLPVPVAGLETLDFALISIHSSFRLSKDEMTRRVLSAMDNPKVKIFAHPTARKLNEREGIDLDWDKIFEKCLAKNIWIEINAEPSRLDLPENLVREAIKLGIKLTLGTDAHHKDGLYNMPFGISVARRGWATKGDIVNTRTLEEFEDLLK